MLILLATNLGYAQQGIQYTQYMYDASLINPAYVGAENVLTINLLHRDQWTGFEGAPQSQTLTIHSPIGRKQIGSGLIINRETIGVHTQLSAAGNFAYHANVGRESFLSFGLKAGVVNRISDFQSVQTATPDNAANQNDFRQTNLDVGLGLLFRNKKLQIGYSIPKLLQQEYELGDSIQVDPGSLNHYVFAGYSFALTDKFDLAPSFLIKYFSGTPLSYDLNLMTSYLDVISAGISYRRNESVDFLVRFQLTPQFELGYAYDLPIGTIGEVSQASHELLLRYVFKFKYSKVVSPR